MTRPSSGSSSSSSSKAAATARRVSPVAAGRYVRVRAPFVHTFASLPFPDVTNHHRSLMTDVTGRIRRPGEMNYAFHASAYALCVGSSFTYREIRNARLLFLADPSGAEAGNISGKR